GLLAIGVIGVGRGAGVGIDGAQQQFARAVVGVADSAIDVLAAEGAAVAVVAQEGRHAQVVEGDPQQTLAVVDVVGGEAPGVLHAQQQPPLHPRPPGVVGGVAYAIVAGQQVAVAGVVTVGGEHAQVVAGLGPLVEGGLVLVLLPGAVGVSHLHQ